ARRGKRRPIEVELTPLHDPAISDSAGAIADRDLGEGLLQSLDERGRAIVVLHYYLGMPLTEVAAFLDLPVGTVKSRLHRALGEMRAVTAVDAVSGPAHATGGQHAGRPTDGSRRGCTRSSARSPRARIPTTSTTSWRARRADASARD